MSQFLSHSPAETEDFGFRLAQQLKAEKSLPCMAEWEWGKQPLQEVWHEVGDRIWYIQPYLCFGT